MSEAIVFVSHNRIVPGKLDGLREYAPEIAEIINARSRVPSPS
jgi:hypothetical protein